MHVKTKLRKLARHVQVQLHRRIDYIHVIIILRRNKHLS